MKWHLNSAQAVRVRGASDAAATPTRLRRSDDFLQFDFFGELQARFDATIALDDAALPLLAVSCAIIAEVCVAFSRNLSDNLADRWPAPTGCPSTRCW